jgi:DNA-directed RNA polymerase subunit RPC12/RpoP
MENEIFKILTKVRKDELSRIDAMEQLFRLFDVSGRSELVCSHCGSPNIDKNGGDGIYCLDCHKEL